MYRTFQSGDEKGIVGLWNDVLIHDPINEKRFRTQVLLDANFDSEGLFVAVEGERIVGAILAITRKLPMIGTDLEPDTGWITFFMVHPEVGRKGIGSGLMEKACDYIRKQGAKKVFSHHTHLIIFFQELMRQPIQQVSPSLKRKGSDVLIHRSLCTGR